MLQIFQEGGSVIITALNENLWTKYLCEQSFDKIPEN